MKQEQHSISNIYKDGWLNEESCTVNMCSRFWNFNLRSLVNGFFFFFFYEFGWFLVHFGLIFFSPNNGLVEC